jgi:hypothetical protein
MKPSLSVYIPHAPPVMFSDHFDATAGTNSAPRYARLENEPAVFLSILIKKDEALNSQTKSKPMQSKKTDMIQQKQTKSLGSLRIYAIITSVHPYSITLV